ncbi:MAG: acyl-CoA dehydrogenase family protein [Acidimicrobiales bacterium]
MTKPLDGPSEGQNKTTSALDAMIDLDHPIKAAASRWATEQLDSGDMIDRDQNCEFWPDGWQRAADHGVLGLMIDPGFGGSGHGVVSALLFFEGLGYGCSDAGLVFALACQVWTTQPIIERFASDELKQRYLPKLVSGESLGAFTITETDSGSDSFAMATTYKPVDGNGYTISGEKAYVTMAPEADVFIVFATKDPALGQWGVTAFLVDAKTPGLTVNPNRPKMGLRTTPFADVSFDGCIVPASQRIGPEGSGAAIFSSAMQAERAFVLAGQIGGMQRQLDDAVSYARDRKQFGQAISSFQAVSHRLAEMKLRHEISRLLLYKAAALAEAGKPSMEAAALAKIQASESAIASSVDTILTTGAHGYVTENEIERRLRDVAGGVVYGGTSDIQRNIVARMLGLS